MARTLPWCNLVVFCVFFVSSMVHAEMLKKSSLPEKERRSHEERGEMYDPSAGIDDDGRIPKIEYPADIKNPERWRYIPEGRIKPGNVFERFLVSSFIMPFFFHEEDVGTGGGIAVTDIDFREKRRSEFAGIFLSYTTEGQQRYTMVWQKWLDYRDNGPNGVFLEERSYIRAFGGYEKTLTRRFYGFGPDTDADDETSYTHEISSTYVQINRSVPGPGDDVVYRVELEGAHHTLGPGHVSGAPATADAFPDEFEKGDDYDILWVKGALRYDTRDSRHSPYKGWMVEGAVESAPLQSNDDSAAIFSLEGNGVIAVPGLFHNGGEGNEENPPTDVLAVGAFVQYTGGELPYWALPSLGGKDTLRGYIRNRFTGRAAWHASAEYRYWVIPRGFGITDEVRIERLGGALFYDIGTVADDLDGLGDARIHDSYGLSFRFTLDRTALFRADIGFSDEGTNFTFAYGLSF